MFETVAFREQIYCIEESTCDIVGIFQRPHSDSAHGELCPPRYAPVLTLKHSTYKLSTVQIYSRKFH